MRFQSTLPPDRLMFWCHSPALVAGIGYHDVRIIGLQGPLLSRGYKG
jgi:hypothetical protein